MRRVGRRALLATGTVAATTAAILWGGTATAGAAPASGDSGLLTTVTKGADMGFPPGKALGRAGGIEKPEVRPQTEADAAAAAQTRTLAISPTGAPVAAPTAVSGRAGLVRSFSGLDGFDSRYANNGNQFSSEPPDQALCAGNGYVFEAVNSVLRVYRPSGSAASGITDLNSFFGYKAALNRSTGVIGPDVYDPTCLFDDATQRWFVTAATLEVNSSTGTPTGPNHIDVAVSRTPNPLGGFAIYRLPAQDDGTQGTPSHKHCPCLGDFPHIAVDKYAFFVTTNEFPFSGHGVFGNVNGAQVYALDKGALTRRASSVHVVHFSHTQLTQGGSTVPALSLAPAQVPGTAYQTANNGTEYLLESLADVGSGQADAIAEYTVTNTRSIGSAQPDLHLSGAIRPSQRYVDPPMTTQKLGPTPLANYCTRTDCFGFGPGQYSEGPVASNDSRMLQVYFAHGRLYGALNTGVQVSGKLQAGIAWFLVNPGSAPAGSSVASQGYIAVANQNVIFPAIAALPSGRGAIGYTLSGQGSYPSAAYSLVSPNGVVGTVHVAGAGAGPQDGFTEYEPLTDASSAPAPRWGDYGAAVPMGSTIWLGSEYIGQSCSFATFQRDPTCNGTRAPFMNWGTRISAVTP